MKMYEVEYVRDNKKYELHVGEDGKVFDAEIRLNQARLNPPVSRHSGRDSLCPRRGHGVRLAAAGIPSPSATWAHRAKRPGLRRALDSLF